LTEPFLAFADQNCVRDLQAPNGRNQDCLTFKRDENGVGVVTALIREAPGQRCGGVNYNTVQ
jgi:hypothetical protein